MTLAGTPPTMALSGTSLVTTEPAPTIAFSPMVTPDRIVAFEPTQTFFFQNDRGRVGSAPVFGGEAVVEGGKDHVMPDLATVVQCHPAMILKMTASVDENVLAYRDILPKIRIEPGGIHEKTDRPAY